MALIDRYKKVMKAQHNLLYKIDLVAEYSGIGKNKVEIISQKKYFFSKYYSRFRQNV